MQQCLDSTDGMLDTPMLSPVTEELDDSVGPLKVRAKSAKQILVSESVSERVSGSVSDCVSG